MHKRDQSAKILEVYGDFLWQFLRKEVKMDFTKSSPNSLKPSSSSLN